MTGSAQGRRGELIIAGASARAACFSAARAGYAPWWTDQFGDADLRARFPGVAVSAAEYPAGIIRALALAPAAPLLYTGALENHPRVLRRIAFLRPLLGNTAEVCARVRDPALLRERLRENGIDCPEVLAAGMPVPPHGRWLRKPLRSGGGLGIDNARAGAVADPGWVLQRYVAGDACSAVFVGTPAGARLLGVTRQLVGEPDFHAPSFSYCGSIGPLAPGPQWLRAGDVLAREFGLRGLFGVDAVVDGEKLDVIEVNPRYTASVEVLEAALGMNAIALHIAACTGRPDVPAGTAIAARADPVQIHGKAILFAPRDLVFADSAASWCAREGPMTCADLPAPGARIARGAPILTLLAHAGDEEGCVALLRESARGVYRLLGAD